MIILAIETSCDETSIAIVKDNRLLIQRTYSQIKHHQAFGGVNPGVARRAHEERLPLLLSEVLQRSRYCLPSSLIPHPSSVAAVAVTIGPGLPPALETGIRFAKDLALQHHLPLIPVNHLEGHIASVFLQRSTGRPFINNIGQLQFPFLSLIVSGGHTELVLSKITDERLEIKDQQNSSFSNLSSVISHRLIGQTLDDAAGEVIDKVGRELGLGYPAGPAVEAMAKQGDPTAHTFPLPLKNTPQDDLNFSFSGLKTKAVQMLVGDHRIGTYTDRVKSSEFGVRSKDAAPNLKPRTPNQIYDFSASFQQAVIDALIFKVKRAIKHTGIKQLVLTGGVSANLELRKQLRTTMRNVGGELFAAPKNFTGDNAAMIGLAAQWAAVRGERASTSKQIQRIDRQANLQFPQLI